MLKCAPVNEDWKIKSKSLKNCATVVESWVIFSLLVKISCTMLWHHSFKNNIALKRFFLLFQSKHVCH